jgi:hypothetical protein
MVDDDGSLRKDLALVRRVLARELDTISEYETYSADASHPRLKEFFRHLAREEKEHVAEAKALLDAFDPEQQAMSASVNVDASHFSGAAPGPAAARAAAPAAAASPVPSVGAFLTVGSLRSRG